jgi:2-polyprenyl-3-methyl-5-hydroxy-6-metoxy-1,4-benzoquinol methylase
MSDYFSPLRHEDHLARYGDNPRTDLLALIQEPPRRVLDIGCGSGAFGVPVKQKYPGVFYVGVEADESVAALARPRLDKVVVANIEQVALDSLDIPKGSFDLIVCADVLEHLYDPWKVLHALSEYLAPAAAKSWPVSPTSRICRSSSV